MTQTSKEKEIVIAAIKLGCKILRQRQLAKRVKKKPTKRYQIIRRVVEC
jgi:hypothetical protein